MFEGPNLGRENFGQSSCSLKMAVSPDLCTRMEQTNSSAPAQLQKHVQKVSLWDRLLPESSVSFDVSWMYFQISLDMCQCRSV